MNEEITPIWPQIGDYVKYIWPNTIPYNFDDAQLSEGNRYKIQMIRYVPSYDCVQICDDNGLMQWIPLYKFNFIDEAE